MDQDNTLEKLIPKIIYNLINNKNVPIYGDGKIHEEWIFVDDHCEALIKVFRRGKIGEFYNIGSNVNMNNLEITKKIFKIFKKLKLPIKSKFYLLKTDLVTTKGML